MPKRTHTYETVKSSIESIGYKLLSSKEEYKNIGSKLLVECNNGHQYSSYWTSLLVVGNRCKKCTRKNDADIEKAFNYVGYKYLGVSGGKEYEDQYSRLDYICDCGHINITTWNTFRGGSRCPDCMKEKYSIIVDAFEKEGYKILATKEEYSNHDTKFRFICPSGHEDSMVWNSFKNGCRCGQCAANKKKTYDEVKKVFEDRGYILISTEYKNSKDDLEFICPNGHQHKISYVNFSSGQGCGVCSGSGPKTIEEISEFCTEKGFILLSDKYVNRNEHLSIRCSNGHEVQTTWDKLRGGYRCVKCGEEKDYLKRYSYFSKIVNSKGGVVVSFSVNNSRVSEVRCDKGHIFRPPRDRIMYADTWCPYCAGVARHTIEFVREELAKEGYTVLSEEYVNAKDKLLVLCPKEHEYEVSWDSFNGGSRCPRCTVNTSYQEIDLRESILSLAPNEKVVLNSRSIIPPYELDLYFPDKNLAIEYCGLYWHSEKAGGKDKHYHREKYNLSLSKGIRLITIFEDEWINYRDVVLSRILSALGVNKRLFARKLKCLEINNKEANDFYIKYHLQGKTSCIKSWGLFDNDILVSCLTVGRLSRYHASNGGKYLELKRMASIPYVNIVGGFSRLFSAAKKYLDTTEFEGIKSYCDSRYANPFKPIYEQLGFVLISETKYTPHYILDRYRFRNQKLAKTELEKTSNKTEWELRSEQGYDRIWDVGHKTFFLGLRNGLNG